MTKTRAEKEHLDKVASLGCIICGAPANIHHIRSGRGLGQRSSHLSVIPLCYRHHQGGGHGVAFHAGKKTWEKNFGTEHELLEIVMEKLGKEE